MISPNNRVIYSGVKHFYNCDATLDVRLIEYPKNDCVEAIVFNSSLGIQYPSLYFKYSTVHSKVVEEDVKSFVASRQAEFLRAKCVVDLGILRDSVRLRLECQYILSLLETEGDISKPGCTVIVSRQHSIHNDASNGVDIWAHKPSVGDLYYMSPGQLHTPTHVTSKEEEDEQLREQMKNAVLRRCLEHLVVKRKFATSGLSVPRKRWLTAIRRVLNQIRVTRTKARIVELFGPGSVYIRETKVMKQTSGLRRGNSSLSGQSANGHQRRLSLESYQLIHQNNNKSSSHLHRQTTLNHVGEVHQLPPLDRALSGAGRRQRRLSGDSVASLVSVVGTASANSSGKTSSGASSSKESRPGIKHQRSFSAGGTGLLQEETLHQMHSCSSIKEDELSVSAARIAGSASGAAAAPLSVAPAAPSSGLVHSGSGSHLSKMLSLRDKHHSNLNSNHSSNHHTPRGTPHGSPKTTPRRLSPIQFPTPPAAASAPAASSAAVAAVDVSIDERQIEF